MRKGDHELIVLSLFFRELHWDYNKNFILSYVSMSASEIAFRIPGRKLVFVYTYCQIYDNSKTQWAIRQGSLEE